MIADECSHIHKERLTRICGPEFFTYKNMPLLGKTWFLVVCGAPGMQYSFGSMAAIDVTKEIT